MLKGKLSEKNASSGYLVLNTWEFYLFYFASFGVHFVPGRPLPKGAKRMEKKESGGGLSGLGLSLGLGGIVSGDSDGSEGASQKASGWWNTSAGDLFGGKSKEEPRDERVETSHVYTYMLEDYMRFYVFKSFEDELKKSRVPLTFLNSDYYNSVSSEYAMLSSSMLEVVLECFFNIADLKTPTEYSIPSDLIIEALTITLKALLRGMRSIRTLEYGPPAIAHSVRGKTGFFKTTQEELFQQLFAATVRNRLYIFLIRAFEYAYWSDSTLRLLRYIIDIWGMVIRPWNLGAPSWMELEDESRDDSPSDIRSLLTDQSKRFVKQLSSVFSGNKGERKGDDSSSSGDSNNSLSLSVEQARRSFVLRNFILYGPTLISFLKMAQRFNLSHKKELKIVSLALSPWDNQDILNMIAEIESCISKTQEARRESLAIAHNIEEVADTARDVLKSADPNLQFTPLRSPVIIDIAQRLVSKMLKNLQTSTSQKITDLLHECIGNVRTVLSLPDQKADPILLDYDSEPELLASSGDPLRKPVKLDYRATSVQRIKDIKFMGNNKYRPITSDENRFIVRRAFELSQLLKRKTGVELNLRVLGAYKIYLWLCVLSIIMLLLIGFGALLQTDFSYDNDYYNYYDSGNEQYDYSRQRAASGGYR